MVVSLEALKADKPRRFDAGEKYPIWEGDRQVRTADGEPAEAECLKNRR
jgi:hypothetical protein